MSVLTTALTTLTLAASSPAATPVEPAFGNTVVSTYPDGRTAHLWMEPGGTYVGQGRKGGRSSGRWTLKGEQVCLRQARPFPFPRSFCVPVPRGGVGTSWRGKAVTGEPVTMTLVKGQPGR